MTTDDGEIEVCRMPVVLTWSSVPGRSYTILYQNGLGGTWNTLLTLTGAAPATTTTYTDNFRGRAGEAIL